MAYCTASDVKSYLGISSSDDDVLIGQLITRAQAAIDRRCNRTFEAGADTTRTFDALGRHISGPYLWLDKDLCQITAVVNGDGATIAPNQYVTTPRNDTPYYGLKLRLNSGVMWTYTTDYEGAISITGRWAYSVSAPYDIAQAAVRLAAFYYRQKDAPLFDVQAIEAGALSTPVAFPGDVAQLLGGYIRR